MIEEPRPKNRSCDTDLMESVSTQLVDALDKLNDILDKCADIFEKVSED